MLRFWPLPDCNDNFYFNTQFIPESCFMEIKIFTLHYLVSSVLYTS